MGVRSVLARTLRPLELVFAAPRISKGRWGDLRQRPRYGACALAAPVHAGAEDIEDERIYHLGHVGQGGRIILARQGVGGGPDRRITWYISLCWPADL